MSVESVITPAYLRDWPLPDSSGSKDARGTVIVVGGARSTPGAAMLAGIAALRVGSGRLTLAVAASVATAVAVGLPECAVIGLPETSDGLLRNASARLTEELGRASVVLIGPGLEGVDETSQLLGALLSQVPEACSVVLDALALGVLHDLDRGLVHALEGRLVLTPNGSEGSRLLGKDPAEGQEPAPIAALQIAETYASVVSLGNSIADGSGRRWQASTGSSGLATSGSGDVLAGAIAGVLAGGATAAQAACWGTHLHGAAGDRLAARVARHGYLARELLDELPAVLTELEA